MLFRSEEEEEEEEEEVKERSGKNEGKFAHREVWLPDLKWDPPTSAAANQDFARRYLLSHPR